MAGRFSGFVYAFSAEPDPAGLAGRHQQDGSLLESGENRPRAGVWLSAQTSFQESLRPIDEGANPLFRCDVSLGLGDIALAQGNWIEAEHLYLQSLSCAKHIDHASHLANTLLTQAHLRRCPGKIVQVAQLAQEGSAFIVEQGNLRLVSLPLLVQGEIAREQGELLQARTLFERGISFAHGRAYWPVIGRLLVGLAAVVLATDRPWRVACLPECTARIHEQTAARGQQRQHEYADPLNRTQALLGEAAKAAAEVQGQAMTLERLPAGDVLPMHVPSMHPAVPQETAPAQPAPAALTKRESEVLHLLARVLTDAQIAQDPGLVTKRGHTVCL